MSNKNDIAWMEIFKKYNILDELKKNKKYIITSKMINEFREARLMTKFDHKNNLPKLFIENELSILPITRGSYIISYFDAYHTFETHNNSITKVEIPKDIESIDFENITSESIAINVVYITGMLDDFLEEKNLRPTVNGRMSSEKFKFNIVNNKTAEYQEIEVDKSQIEIDGGYESLESLTLLEAKNSISEDFLIRQLYYPYRLWENKLRKNIRIIFLVYSNSIFNLYEYKFEDINDYNSLVLKKHKNYSLDDLEIDFDDIKEVYDRSKINSEPEEIPFPQADKFERIINLCEILKSRKILTREEITSEYDFDIRQTNYYTDAARYLGLIDKKREDGNINYSLTKQGKQTLSRNYKERNLIYTKLILNHKPFYKTMQLYIENLELPEKKEIIKIMKESDLYNIRALNTYSRRSSTISSWINWILDLAR